MREALKCSADTQLSAQERRAREKLDCNLLRLQAFLGCRYMNIKDKPQTTAHSWPEDMDIENDHVLSPREKLQVPRQPRRFAEGCGDIYGEGPGTEQARKQVLTENMLETLL